MVVRLDEGEAAIRAYLDSQTSQGHTHVLELVTDDHNRILRLFGDLTEEEATTVTPVDEWSVFDAMKHLSASLDRSRDRLQKLSTGQPFQPPPGVTAGGLGSAEYESFSELRRSYIDGMSDILAVLRKADASHSSDVTADHAQFGPFNWMQWALYSHHIHTHDHVGQIETIRSALRD